MLPVGRLSLRFVVCIDISERTLAVDTTYKTRVSNVRRLERNIIPNHGNIFRLALVGLGYGISSKIIEEVVKRIYSLAALSFARFVEGPEIAVGAPVIRFSAVPFRFGGAVLWWDLVPICRELVFWFSLCWFIFEEFFFVFKCSTIGPRGRLLRFVVFHRTTLERNLLHLLPITLLPIALLDSLCLILLTLRFVFDKDDITQIHVAIGCCYNALLFCLDL